MMSTDPANGGDRVCPSPVSIPLLEVSARMGIIVSERKLFKDCRCWDNINNMMTD